MHWSISRSETLMLCPTSIRRKLFDRDFLTQALAKIGVVDAVFGEQCRHILEPYAVLLCHAANRIIEHLIGNLQSDSSCALQLDFIDDQSFEHLFRQDVGRRQRYALFFGTLRDGVHLLVELAAQDDAFIHNSGDPVQELTRLGEVLGAGGGNRGHE